MSIMDVEDKLEILSEDDFHRRTTLFFTRYKQAHQQEGFQSGSKSLLHTLVSRSKTIHFALCYKYFLNPN